MWGAGWGYWGWGWWFWVFWALVLFLIVWGVGWGWSRHGLDETSIEAGDMGAEEQLLRERYARGEISEEEFERRLKRLRRAA